MKDILIVTNSADPHADAVISRFVETNRILRLNTEGILSDWDFDFDGSECFISDPLGGKINTKDIAAVWYRRPEKPVVQESMHEDLAHVKIDEAWHGLYHVLHSVSDSSWMGHPLRDKRASSRVAQLQIAKSIGFNIPPTCISRKAQEIRTFAGAFDDVVVKPLGNKGITSEALWIPYFSERISSSILLEESDAILGSTFNYLQAYIPKRREWRITVVGREVFPCTLDTQNASGAESDWRRVSHDVIKHQAGILPKGMASKLFLFMDHFDLPFGAFDFIETDQGDFYFLECNANGQWLWIEEHTGMPIAQSIADWLEDSSNR